MRLNRKFLVFSACIIILLSVFAGGCRSHKAVSSKSVKETNFEIKKDHHLSSERKKILHECKGWLGTPYKYAGAEKGVGADCSGVVLMVYLDATDIKLPRNSAKQAEFCKKIKKEQVRPGDLVFFATGKDPDRISHVGIMIDDDVFIHASTSKGVCLSSVSSPYYIRTFKMYGRVPGIHG